MATARGKKKTKRKSLQKNVTVPPGDCADWAAAMKYDGIRSFSQFAVAAIRQRVRRVLQQKALEEKSRTT